MCINGIIIILGNEICAINELTKDVKFRKNDEILMIKLDEKSEEEKFLKKFIGLKTSIIRIDIKRGFYKIIADLYMLLKSLSHRCTFIHLCCENEKLNLIMLISSLIAFSQNIFIKSIYFKFNNEIIKISNEELSLLTRILRNRIDKNFMNEFIQSWFKDFKEVNLSKYSPLVKNTGIVHDLAYLMYVILLT